MEKSILNFVWSRPWGGDLVDFTSSICFSLSEGENWSSCLAVGKWHLGKESGRDSTKCGGYARARKEKALALQARKQKRWQSFLSYSKLENSS